MRCCRVCSIASLVLLIASAAIGHTTIRVQVPEGTRVDNVVRIAHGCGEKPVRAQSVVFPTDMPQLAASDGSTVADLAEVIEQGSLTGLNQLVQDHSIFARQHEKLDASGNVIGFYALDGKLVPGLTGRVPFESTGPSFVASSCAVRLIAEVAIADVCRLGRGPLHPDRINLWIPDNGSRIANDGLAAGIDGIGAPARLVVLRNLQTNPLPASCGAGFDVTVTPSPAQIDRDLPFRGWPAD